MPTVELDGRLAYRLAGDATRDTVLLVHGLGGSRESWGRIPDDLASRHRVVVPDLRGCGDSERGTKAYVFDTLAADIIAILDDAGVRKCHVVGHSLGGVVAQELLTAHGRRCISAVLISTSSRVGERAAEGWRRLADHVERNGLGDPATVVARGFSEAFVETDPDTVRAHGEVACRSDSRVYAEQARIASSYDYTQALARVGQPVLVMQGLADRLTSPGGSVILSRALPNAELEMIEGVGHNLHLELGARFAARLESFFDSIDAKG